MRRPIDWPAYERAARRLGDYLPHAFSYAVEWTLYIERIEQLLDFARARLDEARAREQTTPAPPASERAGQVPHSEESILAHERDTRGGYLP